MAHFAKIGDDNIVETVIVVNNEDILDDSGVESEDIGKQFCENLLGGVWVQTSYNSNFRKRYAIIGGTYDAINDVFVSPKPFDSWTLNSEFDWTAPVPVPDDGKEYYWDEPSLQWVEIPAL
jgi:hypothetical protein